MLRGRYVGVLVELAAVAGSPHGSAVAAQLEDLALRVPDCRPDLVHHARGEPTRLCSLLAQMPAYGLSLYI